MKRGMNSAPRVVARGRGRGMGPRRELTEEERHGLPPGFDFKNLDQSAKELNITQTLTGGRGLVVEHQLLADWYVNYNINFALIHSLLKS